MPELPEVETIARGLDNRVAGDTIESVWLGSKPQTMKSPPTEIAATLENTRIAQVRRMGKHIIFDLERNGEGRTLNNVGPTLLPDPASSTTNRTSKRMAAKTRRSRVSKPLPLGPRSQWIVHLGMTGRMLVCDPAAEVEKHTHAIVKLASGRELRFIDPRRFGRLSVASLAGFEAGGVEPLEIDRDRFIALFHGRKTPIKSALLNQKLLRGVGNIYADESLFRAGLRPRRRASTITRAQYELLHNSVQEVLKEAIALGGSTVSDYVDADGEAGFFQLEHRVHGRQGEPCLVCKTPIKRVVLAGRSSHYCPKCQK
jgi:formamidopyrimidine-DNA glycosylase